MESSKKGRIHETILVNMQFEKMLLALDIIIVAGPAVRSFKQFISYHLSCYHKSSVVT
jgi:hypothetical protein